MVNTLSIRSYNQQKVKHSHDYHQLVLPLRGVINLELDGYKGKVSPGECVIIKAGTEHLFTADTQARFVVADITSLPEPFVLSSQLVFTINEPLHRFIHFIEAQLEYQVSHQIEQHCFTTFSSLLTEQKLFKQIDNRLKQALTYIECHLGETMPIRVLADVACLSPTQFKKLFSSQVGYSPSQYVIKRRMEKAQALLIHTDTPIQIVAEHVGYTDYTAFSRRFTQHFGLSPSKVLS